MNKIFVINGSGGNGKDTFVEMCSEFIDTLNISSVDQVKGIGTQMGWNGKSKTEEDRKFLSDLKDLWTRYSDGPYKYIMNMIFNFESIYEDSFMFIHVREPKEIEKIVNNGRYDISTILVINSNVDKIDSNHADANVENYNYDNVVDNSGTLDDLRMAARNFVKNNLVVDKD